MKHCCCFGVKLVIPIPLFEFEVHPTDISFLFYNIIIPFLCNFGLPFTRKTSIRAKYLWFICQPVCLDIKGIHMNFVRAFGLSLKTLSGIGTLISSFTLVRAAGNCNSSSLPYASLCAPDSYFPPLSPPKAISVGERAVT